MCQQDISAWAVLISASLFLPPHVQRKLTGTFLWQIWLRNMARSTGCPRLWIDFGKWWENDVNYQKLHYPSQQQVVSRFGQGGVRNETEGGIMMRGRGVSCAGKWLLAKIVFSDFNHNECHKGTHRKCSKWSFISLMGARCDILLGDVGIWQYGHLDRFAPLDIDAATPSVVLMPPSGPVWLIGVPYCKHC